MKYIIAFTFDIEANSKQNETRRLRYAEYRQYFFTKDLARAPFGLRAPRIERELRYLHRSNAFGPQIA